MNNGALKISVASGKGGTGKTTIATNLAVALVNAGKDVAYLDGDVEEPNGHIFLKPEITEQFDVTVPVPVVNLDVCTLCGDCSASCEYHAIAVLGKRVEVFPSLCHGCGGCSDICPEDAIEETPRTIGRVSRGVGTGVKFCEGRLNVGEAVSTPVIKALRELGPSSDVAIIDASPGTSCPVIEAIKDTDFVLLVTEPTPFGLNDLKLAVGMVRVIGLPFAVVINRSDTGDNKTDQYCREECIDVLLKIPYDRQVAVAYSSGEMMLSLNPEYQENLQELFRNIADRVNHHGISCS